MHHIYYKYWHQCSKSIYIGINADVTDAGRTGRTTSEDRATQLLICEPLSFAISNGELKSPQLEFAFVMHLYLFCKSNLKYFPVICPVIVLCICIVSSEGALYVILPYDYPARSGTHFLNTHRSLTTTSSINDMMTLLTVISMKTKITEIT